MNEYPTYRELFKELANKRSEVKTIMYDHNIYDWPLEDHDRFPIWMSQETRLTQEMRGALSELRDDVIHIKKLMLLRLNSQK